MALTVEEQKVLFKWLSALGIRTVGEMVAWIKRNTDGTVEDILNQASIRFTFET